MVYTYRSDTMDNVRAPEYNWGIDATLDVIGGKWKPLIIYELNQKTLRFSELLARVQPRISQRMLTKQLRQLEQDGLVIRRVYAQVPPKVEYSLTETGKSLMLILMSLCKWGYDHIKDRVKNPCGPCELKSICSKTD